MRKCAVLLIAALVAVAVPLTLADDSDAAYDETMLTVHLYSVENSREIQCRFYDDMPSTPYVLFSDIFYCFSFTELDVVDNGDGTFTMTNENGSSAVFDVVHDTVSSDDYHVFTNSVSPGNHWSEEDAGKDPNSLVSWYCTDVVTAPGRTVLDLSAYGLDMRDGEGDVWLPVTTASDLLCGSDMFYTVYSGAQLYCFNSLNYAYDEMFPDQMVIEIIGRIYDTAAVRPDDLTRYSYDELCFRMDNLWGNAQRTEFSRMVASEGLDAALDDYSDDSRAIKAMLLDPLYSEYTLGLGGLNVLVFDGGHTNLVFSADLYMESLFDDWQEYKGDRLSGMSLPEILDWSADVELISRTRADAWGEGDYHTWGDTAVYTVDVFESTYAWYAYYDDRSDYPDDTVGNFLRALDAASSDPYIRNFILDLTTCDGGDVGTGMALMAIMTGEEPYTCYTDTLTGAVYADHIHIDVNLDGRYDDNDLRKRCDLNFGILIGRESYSAGNNMPAIAKGKGVTIMGEQGGGGCSSLMYGCTPEGFCYIMSSYNMRCTPDIDPVSLDRGTIPDVWLTDPGTDSEADYSSFFDLAKLSRIMNEQHPRGNVSSEIVIASVIAVMILAASIMLSGFRRKI